MAGSPPTVSVVMSVFDDAAFVSAAVRSILAQSYRDLELVVVDDGSTDRTVSIVESFPDPRIVVVRRSHEGLTRALNAGLAVARGRFVARQDADDVSRPDRLATQVAFLEAQPEVAAVGSGVTLVSEGGSRMGQRRYPTDHAAIVERLRAGTNPLPHSSIVFRRDALAGAGGYDPRFVKAQDYALLLELAGRHRLASIPLPLLELGYRLGSIGLVDGGAEQLRFTLLARALLCVRERRGIDLRRSPEFEAYAREFTAAFHASDRPRRSRAAKLRRAALIRWAEGRRLEAAGLLGRALAQDPRWLPARLFGPRAPWGPELEREALAIADRVLLRAHARADAGQAASEPPITVR